MAKGLNERSRTMRSTWVGKDFPRTGHRSNRESACWICS